MDETERVHKLVLFGAAGSGKSSIINLLADKRVAEVSTSDVPSTKRVRSYSITLGEKNFRLWDTMGFFSGTDRGTNPLAPYEQAHALLRNLSGGVDHILLCCRIDRIDSSLRELYWLLDSFFGGRAPITLVFTHFGLLPQAERAGYWDTNTAILVEKCGIPIHKPLHACIITVYNDSPMSDTPTLDQRSKLVQALLNTPDAGVTLSPIDRSCAKNLSAYCGLCKRDAQRLVKDFALSPRFYNVILFGEAGAGKSSVINLLLGSHAAPISSGMESCTMCFSSYEIGTELHQFRIWDTAGFNGTYLGEEIGLEAMKNAASLVHNLHKQGGVDLLVFCKKSGRLSSSEISTFRLFYEFLCEGQVPVAFIITHLEFEDPMEKWWSMNGGSLLRVFNLEPSNVAAHACITSLDLHGSHFYRKHSLSRGLVQAMLDDSISYRKAFIKDEGIWVWTFLKRFADTVVKFRSMQKKEKEVVKILVTRCGLNRIQAEELAKLFDTRN